MSTALPLLIDGEHLVSGSDEFHQTYDPCTGEARQRVPLSTAAEIECAVAGAAAAFRDWRETPLPQRARLMLKYQQLLKEHADELAALIATESGKTLADAHGDLWRGIEVVEQAAGIARMLQGDYSENVAHGVDTYSLKQPLGVCLGITPFNFPAMIPLWMFPLAIACGNTFILKPSEQVAQTALRLASLLLQAGAPAGVLQVVHGQAAQVEQLIDHAEVRAVSFVGSVAAAQAVYRRAGQALKRAQCLAGAKNHMVILPDANRDAALRALAGAACGAAGQRCMAISAVVFVGAARHWQEELVEHLRQLRPGPPAQTDAAFGPLISASARARVHALIEQGCQEGAVCRLDGRSLTPPAGHAGGYWLGPTLFSGVQPTMSIYREEIFGPVLCSLEVDDLDAAIALINANPYGNGTSLFTGSGASARHFSHHVEVGQIGINLAIPVPLPFFSFTGWRRSFYGDLHAYGQQAVQFYTETKTITTRWQEPTSPASSPSSTTLA